MEQHYRRLIGALPGYELVRLIHAGGQGVVFEALQQSTKRAVAVKFLPTPVDSDQPEHVRAVQRMQREIDTLAGLDDPGIVTIFDSGGVGGYRYFVMELVRGVPLGAYFRSHGFTIDVVVSTLTKVAEALQAAHRAGIVHRDLKPGNVLVEPSGRVRIVDFGLAKLVQRETRATGGPTISETGGFLGTFAWAAPEQLEGADKRIGPRADVYALGGLLYHALVGDFPYPANDPPRLVHDHILHRPPTPLREYRRDVPRDLEAIVQKCLRKSPAQRYADAGELAADLRRLQTRHPVTARPDRWHYRLGLALRRTEVRGRIMAVVLVVIGAALAAQTLAAKIAFRPLESWLYDAVVISRAKWYPDLVVVALTEKCVPELERIAAENGITDVSADNLFSWRRLHGALMERLAQVKPRAVVWDIMFESDQPPYDERLAAGIRALRAAGTPVVLGCRAVDENYAPRLSSAVKPVMSDWGWTIGTKNLTTGVGDGLALIDYHPTLGQHPGLMLATYRALHGDPQSETLRWDYRESVVWRESRTTAGIVATETIPVLDVAEGVVAGYPSASLAAQRFIPFMPIAIPPPETCQRYTTAYRDVFALGSDEFAARFSNKIVLLGDNRARSPSPDLKPIRAVGGVRQEYGVYAHAAGANDLFTGHVLGTPGFVSQLGAALAAAIVGAALTLGIRRARFSVIAVLAMVFIALPVTVAIGAALFDQYFPIRTAAIAMACAALGAAALKMTWRSSTHV